MFLEHDGPVSVGLIIGTVSAVFRVSRLHLLSQRRAAGLVVPRHTAMWLARRLTDRSFPELGRVFQRDHTTIIHAVSRIDRRLLVDEVFADEVLTLERGILRLAGCPAARAWIPRRDIQSRAGHERVSA